MRPYCSPGLSLDANSTSPPQRKAILALQEDLRALGYMSGGLNGSFGPRTEEGLASLSYDLLNNHGASRAGDGPAPVAVADYNRGRVGAAQRTFDQNIAACLDDLMSDAAVPKLPRSDRPGADNAMALAAVAALVGPCAPPPFLLAMFVQESASQHFRTPSATDADDYITVGLDRDKASPEHITSRGYGLGQTTLFHHPPRASEIASLMVDPVGNVAAAFAELRRKFDDFVVGPSDRAVDRAAEHPTLRLRLCRYSSSDPKYFRDCANCARAVKAVVVTQGTPLYPGASAGYQPDGLYPTANYGPVPDRASFLCDWPYAARRYNGSGLDSFHYQTRILLNLARQTAKIPGGDS